MGSGEWQQVTIGIKSYPFNRVNFSLIRPPSGNIQYAIELETQEIRGGLRTRDIYSVLINLKGAHMTELNKINRK